MSQIVSLAWKSVPGYGWLKSKEAALQHDEARRDPYPGTLFRSNGGENRTRVNSYQHHASYNLFTRLDKQTTSTCDWTQALGPIDDDNKTLVGKAKDWIDIDASLVVIVKLYGTKHNKMPGMLVALVTDNEGVRQVIRVGEIGI